MLTKDVAVDAVFTLKSWYNFQKIQFRLGRARQTGDLVEKGSADDEFLDIQRTRFVAPINMVILSEN